MMLCCKDCLDMLDLRKDDLRSIGHNASLCELLAVRFEYSKLRGVAATEKSSSCTAGQASKTPERRKRRHTRRNVMATSS